MQGVVVVAKAMIKTGNKLFIPRPVHTYIFIAGWTPNIYFSIRFQCRIDNHHNHYPISLTIKYGFCGQGRNILRKHIFMVLNISKEGAKKDDCQTNQPFVTCFHVFHF